VFRLRFEFRLFHCVHRPSDFSPRSPTWPRVVFRPSIVLVYAALTDAHARRFRNTKLIVSTKLNFARVDQFLIHFRRLHTTIDYRTRCRRPFRHFRRECQCPINVRCRSTTVKDSIYSREINRIPINRRSGTTAPSPCYHLLSSHRFRSYTTLCFLFLNHAIRDRRFAFDSYQGPGADWEVNGPNPSITDSL